MDPADTPPELPAPIDSGAEPSPPTEVAEVSPIVPLDPAAEPAPASHLGFEPPPPSGVFAPPSLRFLLLVAGCSMLADLASKFWAKEALSGPGRAMRMAKRMHLIRDHVDLIFAQNPGGAWSFLRSLPDSLRRPFFLVVSASAIVFIVSIYRRVRPEQWAMRWGLPLALGGALGNLVDRIRYGWVVDFVDIYMNRDGSEHHWPTFNVADIAIVIGVGLMAFEMMRPRREKERAAPAPMPSEMG